MDYSLGKTQGLASGCIIPISSVKWAQAADGVSGTLRSFFGSFLVLAASHFVHDLRALQSLSYVKILRGI
ncbi:MAG: hypothetical protein KGO02_10260 [Alphaproteobacteria bacterium]|nr:hypothetical protein [Alphaproteobacteria bacterium]